MTTLKNSAAFVSLMAFAQLTVAGVFPPLGVGVPLQFGGIAAIVAVSLIIGAQLINRKK